MPEEPENKAENIEAKPRTEESILREQFGGLQLRREALVGMVQQVEQQMSPIRQKLIAIEQAKGRS